MPDMTESQNAAFRTAAGMRRFELTIYVGGLKVVGIVFHSSDTRSSSRRPSDFLHALNQPRLTLSSPRIYERTSDKVIDEPPFTVVTMERIDAMHAIELEEGEQPEELQERGEPLTPM